MTRDLSHFTVYLVGHAHIDLGYRWRWNETVHRIARDTFRGVLRMMEAVPEFTFVQSQLALYAAMQEHYPALFAQIRQRIAEGRWIVADGWCEYDHTMPGGESMIRQHLIGGRYAREELGCEVTLAWAPDAFSGHAHTLPSILKGCGIEHLLYGRGVPEETGPRFWWEGPDGTRVLAYSPAYGYSADLGPRVYEVIERWRALTGDDEMLFLYGRGDHGGGPREGDFEALQTLRHEPDAPRYVHTTPQFFFREVLATKTDLPVYRGELGGDFTGSCASVGRAKQRNRQMENLILTAERFATLAMFLQRKPSYPRVDFEDAWKVISQHEFHDELPGTSVAGVYLDNEADYQRIERLLNDTLDASLAEIAARLDTRAEGRSAAAVPLVVYNPLAWARSEPVRVTLRLNAKPEGLLVRNTDGHEVPTQVFDVWQQAPYWYAEVGFLARDVPSLGYRVFWAEPALQHEPAEGLLLLSLARAETLRRARAKTLHRSRAVTAKLEDLDETRRALFESHVHLISEIAQQHAKHGIPEEVLLEAGTEGLLRAAELYDETKGHPFEAYARWWIGQAIHGLLDALGQEASLIRQGLQSLEPREGEVRTGVVTRLVEYGAFVDLGGIEGLIHISELDWQPVEHPREVLAVGDEVEVYVLHVDRERGRIGLSRKRALSDPRSAFPILPGAFAGFAAAELAAVTVLQTPVDVMLENTFLRVTVSRETGQLVQVWDKRAHREVLSGPGNVLQAIAEVPHEGTAWVLALSDEVDQLDRSESVEVVQKGPLQVAVRVAYRYRDSYFEQTISLSAGSPLLDLRLHAHWYECDRCLKVVFPAAVEEGEARFESPLGSIVRPADGSEVPALRWIDVSSDGASSDAYGVSLLNDCRYAFDVNNSTMRMTLLRGFPDMSPEADAGEHELHYALYPHAGLWRDADTVRQGWAFNMPLIARQALRRAGVIAPWVGPGINHAMPPAFGFLTVEQENVALTAFKLEDEVWGPGSPVIVRLYETVGKETESKITFAVPLMMIEETNHLEARIESNAFDWDGEAEITVRFRPHEIKTFRLRLAIPAFAIYEGADHRDDIAPGAVPGFGDG